MSAGTGRKPAARHPELSREYGNLLCSCTTCNATKGDELVPDPCQVLINGDIKVGTDGVLEARTHEARRRVRVLGLDSRRE